MKVRVSYTTIVEEVVEIDEKFHRLTESGGWDELSSKERNALIAEFLEDVLDRSDANYHNIVAIREYDTDELMY